MRECAPGRDIANHAATMFSIKLYFLYFCEMERLSNLIAQGHLGSVFSSRKNHETEILVKINYFVAIITSNITIIVTKRLETFYLLPSFFHYVQSYSMNIVFNRISL